MNLLLKRFFMALFGLLAALALWPLLLSLRAAQAAFPSYLTFTLAQGAVFGLVFGLFFGSFEGVVVSSRPKAYMGALTGAAAGAVAGILGSLAGQFFLFAAGPLLWRGAEARGAVGTAVASALSWAIIGVAVALIEGLRSRSARKLLVGLLGGLVGGLLGGASIASLAYLFPGNDLALLAGLSAFGLFLAGFYSLFENRFSFGSLMLLNGPNKGKEYYVLSKRMKIGSSADCDIVLAGYPGVDKVHACIETVKGRVLLTPERAAGATVLLNDQPPASRELRPEDVVSVGKAKFIYGYFG